MAIKKIKAKSPDPYLSKTIGDNTLARIAHVNQLVDQINSNDPRPYKVYTALLTQSGGDGEGYTAGGDLTIGVSYRINTLAIGMDFTNVGALNNDIGTWFVATGTTPNSWGIDGDEVLFYNPGAPTVTVLENTIGNIWFTYESAGVYYLNSSNVFLENKYFAPMPASLYDEGVNQGGGGSGYNWVRFSNSIVIISLLNGDNQLNNTPIEIRVYN